MIETDDGFRIIVSNHAARQALRRIPELAGRKQQDAIYWCENMALASLRAGRRARTCPRWCVRVWANGFSRRKKTKCEGMSRYFWDAAETYVLLASRTRKGCGGDPDEWVIVTVMTPEPERPPLAAAEPVLV